MDALTPMVMAEKILLMHSLRITPNLMIQMEMVGEIANQEQILIDAHMISEYSTVLMERDVRLLAI